MYKGSLYLGVLHNEYGRACTAPVPATPCPSLRLPSPRLPSALVCSPAAPVPAQLTIELCDHLQFEIEDAALKDCTQSPILLHVLERRALEKAGEFNSQNVSNTLWTLCLLIRCYPAVACRLSLALQPRAQVLANREEFGIETLSQ